MRYAFFSLAIAVTAMSLCTARADTADKTAALATVNQFVDSFNRSDQDGVGATCATQAVVVDDLAPYIWQGENACRRWIAALGAFSTKVGLAGLAVTLGDPWQISISDDVAYGVFPASVRYTLKGRPGTDDGVWTIVLIKVSGQWRISDITLGQH